MAISVNIQRIKSARARRISDYFSTVDCTCHDASDGTYLGLNEVSLFIEGPGHEDAAARIAALINEQVVRRDAPPAPEPEVPIKPINLMDALRASISSSPDDGPTYDEADNEQQRQEAEEAAYNAEDQAGKEAHLRSVRRDDKPWTPHEDEIERDVREGRRDTDGEPLTQEEIEKQEAERNLPYSGSF